MYMCVCIYICTGLCECIYVHTYHPKLCITRNMCARARARACACMHVCKRLCACTCALIYDYRNI